MKASEAEARVCCVLCQAKGDTTAMIALQGAIRFNGGGHLNHSIFWQNLAPPKAGGGIYAGTMQWGDG